MAIFTKYRNFVFGAKSVHWQSVLKITLPVGDLIIISYGEMRHLWDCKGVGASS